MCVAQVQADRAALHLPVPIEFVEVRGTKFQTRRAGMYRFAGQVPGAWTSGNWVGAFRPYYTSYASVYSYVLHMSNETSDDFTWAISGALGPCCADATIAARSENQALNPAGATPSPTDPSLLWNEWDSSRNMWVLNDELIVSCAASPSPPPSMPPSPSPPVPPTPPPQSPPPSPPPSPPGICNDECPSARDDRCSDGGPGSSASGCPIGTDCTDCNIRLFDECAVGCLAHFLNDGTCNPECNVYACSHNDCTSEEIIDTCLERMPHSMIKAFNESMELRVNVHLGDLAVILDGDTLQYYTENSTSAAT
eukprot:1656486-Prymnesium_polylepis.1